MKMPTTTRHVQATATCADDLPELIAQIFESRKQVFVFLDGRKPWLPRFKVFTRGDDLRRAESRPHEFTLVGTYTRDGCDMGQVVEDAKEAHRALCAPPTLRITDPHRFIDSGNELSE